MNLSFSSHAFLVRLVIGFEPETDIPFIDVSPGIEPITKGGVGELLGPYQKAGDLPSSSVELDWTLKVRLHFSLFLSGPLAHPYTLLSCVDSTPSFTRLEVSSSTKGSFKVPSLSRGRARADFSLSRFAHRYILSASFSP